MCYSEHNSTLVACILQLMELKLSYSRMKTYRQCGTQYDFKYNVGLPDLPGWYNVGGSAVHSMTEDRDMASFGMPAEGREQWTFKDYFEAEEAAVLADTDTPPELWKTAGRKTKLLPRGEDRKWWLNEGPSMVNRWTNWINSVPYDIWITPDGEPAIEIQFEHEIDDEGTTIRGAIDRVLVARDTGKLVVVDIKSGKPPKDNVQLATYADALLRRYGVQADFGGYWMARGGVITGMYDLSSERGAKLRYVYHKTSQGIRSETFLPNPSGLCDYCPFQVFCPWGGKLEDMSHLPYSEESVD